jgi:glycosyltransferase involved in cell wall biosynthesis
LNTSPAKVAVTVNLMWCVPGAVGGSEDYLVRQLLGIPQTEFDITVCAPKGFVAAHPEIANIHRIIESDHDGRSRPRRVLSESTWLYAQSEGAALVHHGGGTIPSRHRSPTVLTIHDLQYREFPQYVQSHKLAYLKTVMPRSARRADVIAVPTEFVKQTVVDAYGISPDRIVVVQHGIESTLGTSATSEAELRSKYSLGAAPIVLLPAMTHPHKGHLFVLDVMEKSWKAQGLQLVLIGAAGAADDAVNQRASSSRLNTCVKKLGRVSKADRDGLIKMSKALVFPSEYEGFGAPVIEAMALGTPVICSDRACLPEVVGDAGLVLPLDVDAWAGALDLIELRRAQYLEASARRLENFTAEASGRALASAYRLALS